MCCTVRLTVFDISCNNRTRVDQRRRHGLGHGGTGRGRDAEARALQRREARDGRHVVDQRVDGLGQRIGERAVNRAAGARRAKRVELPPGF